MEDKNLPVESPAHVPMDMSQSLFFNADRFELAQRVAKMFMSSDMVPEHFRNNLGNCLIALELADRMKCNAFMLLQNMYIIHGKPGIEAKLAIALVNATGKFTPLQYVYNDNKTECYAHAKLTGSGEECRGVTVSIEMAKAEGWMSKKGSKWQTMPELMLMYRAAMFFARTFCPEALLGMQTRDELYDVGTVEMVSNGAGSFTPEPTVEELEAKILNRSEPQDEPAWYDTKYWMKQKQSGFTALMIDRADSISDIPDNAVCSYKGRSMGIVAALREKWAAINPDKPFPGDEMLEAILDAEVEPTARSHVSLPCLDCGKVHPQTEACPPEPPIMTESAPDTSNQFAEKLRSENRALKQMFPETWDAARRQFDFPDAIGTLSDEAISRWNSQINELVDQDNA